MARQKKFKKMKMPKALEGVKEFVLKRVAGIIVLIIFIALVWILTVAFLEKSDYFKVKFVEAEGAADASLVSVKAELLSHYKGKNIFKINLAAISGSLKPRYPDAKDRIVRKVLPDRLFVEMEFRSPAALLDNGRLYPVDRECFILVNMDVTKLKYLPVIRGIDFRYALKSHSKCDSRNLKAALSLIDEIKRARFLERYHVRVINAGDIKNLSFYLGDGGPAVIIGHEDFKERLKALKDTLTDQKLLLDRINYIDVRFRDVAISPKGPAPS